MQVLEVFDFLCTCSVTFGTESGSFRIRPPEIDLGSPHAGYSALLGNGGVYSTVVVGTLENVPASYDLEGHLYTSSGLCYFYDFDTVRQINLPHCAVTSFQLKRLSRRCR